PVPFAGVQHLQPFLPPSREQFLVRLNRTAQLRYVVAEQLAESARFQEIALHVNDDQSARRRHELERVRFGVNCQRRSRFHGAGRSKSELAAMSRRGVSAESSRAKTVPCPLPPDGFHAGVSVETGWLM